jgi:hypothetical protein
MCSALIPDEHGHVVEVAKRRLMCTCRPCSLLFSNTGAAGGRFKPVPDRYLSMPEYRLPLVAWEQMAIPVQLAFFLHNSLLDRIVCFYPSPAGATESLLPLETLHEVMTGNPLLEALEPDVEGLIMRRGHDGCICYVAPIDACYELVGRVRQTWKGFDGGSEAWERIDAFFAQLEERSRPVET